MSLKPILLTLTANDLNLLSAACRVAGIYYDTITIPALRSGDVAQLYDFGYYPEEERADDAALFEVAIADAQRNIEDFAGMEARLEVVMQETWGRRAQQAENERLRARLNSERLRARLNKPGDAQQ